MKKTMITDYKATLQEFFMEVIKFLDNRMAFAKDEIEYQKICKVEIYLAFFMQNSKNHVKSVLCSKNANFHQKVSEKKRIILCRVIYVQPMPKNYGRNI